MLDVKRACRAAQIDQRRNRPGGWHEATAALTLWELGLARLHPAVASTARLADTMGRRLRPRSLAAFPVSELRRFEREAWEGQLAAAWLADRTAALRWIVLRAVDGALAWADVDPNAHGHADWRIHLGLPIWEAQLACGLTLKRRGRREALELLVRWGTSCPPAPFGGWPDHWRAERPASPDIEDVGRPPFPSVFDRRPPSPAMEDAVRRVLVSAWDWDNRYFRAWDDAWDRRRDEWRPGPPETFVRVPPVPNLGERTRRRLRRLRARGRRWKREGGAAPARTSFQTDARGNLWMHVGNRRKRLADVRRPPFEAPPIRQRAKGEPPAWAPAEAWDAWPGPSWPSLA